MTTPYYQDESVTLYHGDCRQITDWLGADVLVTDPPYGYSHSSGWLGKFQGEEIANDADTGARDRVLEMWRAKSSLRPALVFGSWKRPKPDGVHTVLTWDKGDAAGMGNLAIPWKPNTEEIYVIGHGFRGRRTSSVISGHTVVTWASKGREHPNMKPEGLITELLLKCPKGVVADPFSGSGSTLLAARRAGRRAIGVELEERYCEVTAKRLAQGVLDFGEVS